MVDQYRVILCNSPQDAEREMNAAAEEDFRFLSMTAQGDRLYIVMEHSGGNAGNVQSEALQAGIPSQGPTAERQWSEQSLGTGRL